MTAKYPKRIIFKATYMYMSICWFDMNEIPGKNKYFKVNELYGIDCKYCICSFPYINFTRTLCIERIYYKDMLIYGFGISISLRSNHKAVEIRLALWT